MLFIIISLLVYLAVGAQFSRYRYASLAADREGIQLRKELEEERSGLKSATDNTGLKHTMNCRSREWSSKQYKLEYCNCGAKRRVTEIGKQLQILPKEPGVILPMVAFPVYFMESYLKGGKVKPTPESLQAYIERREKELQIGQ